MLYSLLLFVCFFMQSYFIYAVQYVYPVAQFNNHDNSYVLLMHQDHNGATRLWLYDIQTNHYEKLLSSQYNPIEVQLLPDISGFSFIDNGLIKVKKFTKRSPKSIELYEPIGNISYIHWINTSTCYFHAKRGSRYSIYQTDVEGELKCIASDSDGDCLYPQKIDDCLYYINRSTDDGYAVIKAHYCVESIAEKCAQPVIKFGQQAIAFLRMLNNREGFVVGHADHIDLSEPCSMFHYYRIYFLDGKWKCEDLFTFCVPNWLFFDNKISLRENIMPLLPRIIAGDIYFSSTQRSDTLDLFHYDMHLGSISKLPGARFFSVPGNTIAHFHKNNMACCRYAPIMAEGTLWAGKSLEL